MSKEVVRTKDQIQLFDKKAVVNTTEQISESVPCAPFRKFGLYIDCDSTGSPTTIQYKVQFLDRWTGKWFTHKQGLFASLFYEDTDTASGIFECFTGDVLGRAMRVTLTGVGTTGSAYFTTSVSLDFWN